MVSGRVQGDVGPMTEADLSVHRPSLRGYCYRMLGSIDDAEDAVQDTLLKAWRRRETFAGRASLSTWLHAIATNVCLDVLKDRRRRGRPTDTPEPGTVDDALEAMPREHWLDPAPTAWAFGSDDTPARQVELQQTISLAYVAALQHLPPKQRAILLLVEVLEWSAAEVAESLQTSVASVNSALQRARAKVSTARLSARPDRLSTEEQALVVRFVDAFERYDVEALCKLLADDARMSMPPYQLWLQGRASIAAWLLGRGIGCRGSRLLPTSANGLPAFGQYHAAAAPGALRRPWVAGRVGARGRQNRGLEPLPRHGPSVSPFRSAARNLDWSILPMSCHGLLVLRA